MKLHFFLKLLKIDFQALVNFEMETFATAELCIANLSNTPDLNSLNYHLKLLK